MTTERFIQHGKSAIASFIHRALRQERHSPAKEPNAPTGKSLRHGMARVEYLACEQTIHQLMAEGFSKKLIHERLIKDGSISMSYITLCKFIQKSAQASPTMKEPLPSVDPSTLF